MVDSAYAPTRHFCDRELKRLGVATRYYDPLAAPEEVEALVGAKTRAIFMENPGSLTFEIQDVPGICAMAKQRGITRLLDNTWATPVLQRPLELGADLVMHSTTKYLGGHSDLTGGALVAPAEDDWTARLRTLQALGGAIPSAFDCWLLMRGIRSLPWRMRGHCENAAGVAAFLAAHAAVAAQLGEQLGRIAAHPLALDARRPTPARHLTRAWPRASPPPGTRARGRTAPRLLLNASPAASPHFPPGKPRAVNRSPVADERDRRGVGLDDVARRLSRRRDRERATGCARRAAGTRRAASPANVLTPSTMYSLRTSSSPAACASSGRSCYCPCA